MPKAIELFGDALNASDDLWHSTSSFQQFNKGYKNTFDWEYIEDMVKLSKLLYC